MRRCGCVDIRGTSSFVLCIMPSEQYVMYIVNVAA